LALPAWEADILPLNYARKDSSQPLFYKDCCETVKLISSRTGAASEAPKTDELIIDIRIAAIV